MHDAVSKWGSRNRYSRCIPDVEGMLALVKLGRRNSEASGGSSSHRLGSRTPSTRRQDKVDKQSELSAWRKASLFQNARTNEELVTDLAG